MSAEDKQGSYQGKMLSEEESASDIIRYYDQNALAFYKRTMDINMVGAYQEFLRYLPTKGSILDAGCGVGRDSKYFMSQGYSVVAFDASPEMVKLATSELNQPALQLCFHGMVFQNEFDGIWANASLLHIPYAETREILEKMHTALKPGGVFFATYKYGDQQMSKDGRAFFNMNQETILPYLHGLFDILNLKEVADTRNTTALRPTQSWLHILCRSR